ncbi:hypothetical protein KP79_PYT23102 [Mizuhopecten yessoensis]|uniref:Chitin-binding type-4 domain-containing protein n=1 Tax=Mizuhopecten yessoensis TaxID=6573 RepID=A0A210R3C7_MIZYE|nr:hypothetical protein KP79_PYT23102 [Mizuhopecten yessoensis]
MLPFILVILASLESVECRGKMMEPVQRSSLWRKGYNTPQNMEDSGLNCGGYWYQWQSNKGRCGVCGDPADVDPKPNEDIHQYAKGIIVQRYLTSDKFIDVTIEVKKNMLGYFEFRLCPDVSETRPVTQKCLDQHPLDISGHGKRYRPDREGNIFLKLNIPKEVTCEHCVLQWKWHTAMNWGICKDKSSGLGCGDQEELYNCADISITSGSSRAGIDAQIDSLKYTLPSQLSEIDTNVETSINRQPSVNTNTEVQMKIENFKINPDTTLKTETKPTIINQQIATTTGEPAPLVTNKLINQQIATTTGEPAPLVTNKLINQQITPTTGEPAPLVTNKLINQQITTTTDEPAPLVTNKPSSAAFESSPSLELSPDPKPAVVFTGTYSTIGDMNSTSTEGKHVNLPDSTLVGSTGSYSNTVPSDKPTPVKYVTVTEPAIVESTSAGSVSPIFEFNDKIPADKMANRMANSQVQVQKDMDPSFTAPPVNIQADPAAKTTGSADIIQLPFVGDTTRPAEKNNQSESGMNGANMKQKTAQGRTVRSVIQRTTSSSRPSDGWTPLMDSDMGSGPAGIHSNNRPAGPNRQKQAPGGNIIPGDQAFSVGMPSSFNKNSGRVGSTSLWQGAMSNNQGEVGVYTFTKAWRGIGQRWTSYFYAKYE